MAKLFEWAQVQKFWNKCKAAFLAKDSSGNVTVSGKATVKDMEVTGNSQFNKSITLVNTEGSTTAAYTLEGTVSGSLLLNGRALATFNDVTSAIANAGHLKREKVDALPGVASATENVIYMVPRTTAENENVYDEYMFFKATNKFEKMGSTDVDLSGYSTTEQMNSAISTAVSNSYTLITDAEIDSLT
jgi:hypothetical protein